MNDVIRDRLQSNPFSTRFVRPGALRYQFENGESASTIADRFESHGGRGAIVGPHGSGKSTLLAELIPELECRGWIVRKFSLHDGQRALPIPLRQLELSDRGARTLLVIDGYEQLSRWQRWRISRYCARLSIGLLVTTHAATSLPTLTITRTSPALLEKVVQDLIPSHAPEFAAEELARVFAESRGNLRESLFALYDRYERISRRADR